MRNNHPGLFSRWMNGRFARFVNDKIRLTTALVLIPAGLSLFAEAHWLVELTSHFQAHYFVTLALCLAGLLLFRDWRWSVIAAVGVIFTGVTVVPWHFGRASALPPDGTLLRLLLANVYTANTASERLLELVREERIDVAVLQEIDRRWLGELEPMRESMPHAKSVPRDDNFGIGVWSRHPLEQMQEFASGLFEVPSISTEIEVGGRRLRIIATHPVPPASGEGSKARNAQLEELAAMAAQSSLPVILIGDLNVTMWSPFCRRLEKVSGLKNARKGFGILPTWPAQFHGLGIPLDHCFVDPSLRVRSIRVGQAIGSDHLPLIVDLLVPSGK